MSTHHGNYCLKPMLMLAGIKQHITQSAGCQQQWREVLNCTATTVPVEDDHQTDDDLSDNAPAAPPEWHYESDGKDHWYSSYSLVLNPVSPIPQDGSLLANIGCFVEQYTAVAAQILGTQPTIFKEMERTEGQEHKNSLQTGPAWTCEMIDVAGNVVDSAGKNHIYDEMWTADWWWDVQVSSHLQILRLNEAKDNCTTGKVACQGTVAPIILSSDKTSLSVFSGNKKAWLVYLTIGNISKDVRNGQSRKFNDEGLHAMYKPFWKDLPFTNIFTCITPNILHQLHKGIFDDHLLQLCINIVREKEVDVHFQAMNRYPGLCHFAKGISTISQWTGTEHKEIQRVFMGLLSGAVDDHVLMCQQHMDLSLKAMEESLKTFHNHKQVLIDLQIQYPEHLHIDYAKDAYHMALWLQHQEAIHHKSAYLAWRQLKRLLHMDSVDGTACGIGKSDSVSSDLGLCVKVQYKVTKYPSHCRVTMDQIHAKYKAPDFILVLKQFLASLSSRNQAVQPTESDCFDIFHSISIAIGPSTITGHDKGMQRVQATPTINACGHKPKTPACSDTIFVLEAGHQSGSFPATCFECEATS
ncbi:hypothetical protein EDC04DRAFT_2611630 [Pisolithus marmoratus]|nr:hypothetical protein EDC04DRAFT_2611630 [Pisolithus marmoratus]